MKKFKEVCDMVGVTRRTLQEYDKIGLLEPTVKTKFKPWLYDDEAISKLLFIQMFVEAGYKRKEIMKILDSSQMSIDLLREEYDKAIRILKEKEKRIHGMIIELTLEKRTLNYPEHILMAMMKRNISERFKEKSFKEALEEELLEFSDISEEDIPEDNGEVEFTRNVLAIGCLKNEDINSDLVKKCLAKTAEVLWRWFLEDQDEEYSPEEVQHELDEISETEFEELFRDFLMREVDSPEYEEVLNEYCGEGAFEFVKRVIQKHSIKKRMILKED